MLPFIEELVHQRDLLDFKPSKILYIWRNNRFGADHISSYFDRFLIQSMFYKKGG
jgi:hypothetical protein